MVDDLAQALGDRLEVAAGEAAVGGEALGEDEEVAAALGQVVVVHGQPAADVGEAVLLGAHRHPVGERGDLPHDVATARSACPGSRSRMNQAFSAKRQASRNSGTPWRSQIARTPRRFSSDTGWPPPELLVMVMNTTGTSARRAVEQLVEAVEVHVPLERVEGAGVEPLRDHEVDGLGARGLDVGPRGVEVGVVRDDLAGTGDRR